MTHRMDPLNYMCRPKSKPKTEPITGLAYFRKKQGYRQIDFAELMGINACEWNIIERGHQKPSIGVLIRASKLLHVTLDELVEQYQEEAADEQEK